MKLYITTKWKKMYKNLPIEIRLKAKKQYKLFKTDMFHSSLHFKKVHSSQPIFSARIDTNYRTVGIVNDNKIVWFFIGNHQDYERVIR